MHFIENTMLFADEAPEMNNIVTPDAYHLN